MATGVGLDAHLIQSIQVAATSRNQLDDLLLAARSGNPSDKGNAFAGFMLLTTALALAYRPESCSPMEAVGAANRALLNLITDPSVSDVVAALPAAIEEACLTVGDHAG